MRLFDTHCHLSGKSLGSRAPECLKSATQNNVSGVCIIATSHEDLAETSKLAADLKKEFPDVLVAHSSGIHPHEADSCDKSLWQQVALEAQNANAIGETGLDFYYDFSDREAQKNVFQKHIDLAIDLQKPLVIHCRNSATEILEQLESSKISQKSSRPGILHCFTEDYDTAKKCLDQGLMISFAGILTFKNADALRETAKKIPLDRILIETDAPYLSPIPYRGKENEPAFLLKTFDVLCEIRTEPKEILSHALWQNSCKIFGLNHEP